MASLVSNQTRPSLRGFTERRPPRPVRRPTPHPHPSAWLCPPTFEVEVLARPDPPTLHCGGTAAVIIALFSVPNPRRFPTHFHRRQPVTRSRCNHRGGAPVTCGGGDERCLSVGGSDGVGVGNSGSGVTTIACHGLQMTKQRILLLDHVPEKEATGRHHRCALLAGRFRPGSLSPTCSCKQALRPQSHSQQKELVSSAAGARMMIAQKKKRADASRCCTALLAR